MRYGLLAVCALLSVSLASHAGGAGTERAAAEHEDFVPVWSPDARYIAFDRQTGRLYRDSVFLVGVKGGAERQLVTPGAFPSWSPDGSRIAYHDVAVLTIKLDGAGRKRLTRYGSFPRWSPDGRSILFENTWADGLHVVPATGGKARRVAQGATDAQWSPDGGKIVFVTGAGGLLVRERISIVGRDGRGLRALGLGSKPSWSPDGREIAYGLGGRAEPSSVHVMWNDGSHRRVLAAGESPGVLARGETDRLSRQR